MAKKNITTKVIAGLVSATTLVGGADEVLSSPEVEIKSEVDGKKRKQNELIIMSTIAENDLSNSDNAEVAVINNSDNNIENLVAIKYNIDINKLEINISNHENQEVISPIKEIETTKLLPENVETEKSETIKTLTTQLHETNAAINDLQNQLLQVEAATVDSGVNLTQLIVEKERWAGNKNAE